MALYRTDKDNNVKKIAGNYGSDKNKANRSADNLSEADLINWKNKLKLDNKANKDLSNVTYPTNTLGSTTTGAGDRVIETYISSDGNTWYRKWASGWKECGGNYSTTTQITAALEIKLPLTFINTPTINVQYIRNYLKEDTVYYGWITEKNVSSFKYYTYWSTDGNISIDYYCCGY